MLLEMQKRKNSIVLLMVISILLSLTVPFFYQVKVNAETVNTTDVPDEMLNNSLLRSLRYTGYDVERQINDGTIFHEGHYGGSLEGSDILSGITYNQNLTGMEMEYNENTLTGKAPKMSAFRQYGFCCASFVMYYMCNYLPNIEGVDTSVIFDALKEYRDKGWSYQAVWTWQMAMNSLTSKGKIEKIYSGGTLNYDIIEIGDIIIFGDESNSHKHIAVYAGEYNGKHFIIHTGTPRGPEICTCEDMANAGEKASTPNAIYRTSVIINQIGNVEVTKTSEDNKIEGVKFRLSGTAFSGDKVDMYAVTNNAGKAVFTDVPIGNGYSVEEVEIKQQYIQPEKQTADVQWNTVSELMFNNVLKRGSVEIVKTAEDSMVSGIKFRLYGTAQNGQNIDLNAVTDSSGRAAFNNILIGQYTIEEVDTDSKYIVPEKQTITIEWDKTVTKNFNNALQRGNVEVVKNSEDGFISDVKFRLHGTASNGESVDLQATTNAEGKALFTNVLVGTYTVKELETKKYYIVPSSQTVAVESGKTVTKRFNNVLKRGAVEITKTSEDGAVSEVKFRLHGTATNGETVDLQATTNADGKAIFSNVLIGNYMIEEVDAKGQYILPNSQSVVVEWNKTVAKTFSNVLKRGNVEVIKTSEDGFVSEVKFRLRGTATNGETVDLQATTNAEGKAIFSNVLIGNYMIEEVDAKGHYIVPNSQVVVVEWNETITKTFNNVLKRGNIIVTKTSEDGLVKNLKFHLTGTSNNGTLIDMYATTDENEKTVFSDILIGSYTLEEVETTSRYIIPENKIVNVEWSKAVNVQFENRLKRGTVSVTKTSEDGIDTGIKFHLFGTSLSGASVDEYAITDNNGVAVFENILIGSNYTIEEVDTAEWYVKPENQNVNVVWNELSKSVFNNVLKRGNVFVSKTSEDGKVDGVKFRLYGTSVSGQTVDVYAVTDKDGVATFEDVLVGNYLIEEVDVKEYYIAQETQKISVEWNKIANCSFYNELKRGNVIVTKTSEDGLIKNLKFHLSGTSKNGTLIDMYSVTDETGKAVFSDVLIGSYILEEVETTSRYIIPESKIVNVEWNKAVNVQFENRLKRGTVSVTKISEDGYVSGVKFHLTGMSMSGMSIDEYAVTDIDGIAVFKNILIGSNYTIEEVDTPQWYIKPKKQVVNVVWNETCRLAFNNVLKRGNIVISKTSDDGIIEGMKFHLYGTSDSGIYVDEISVTNSDGKAEFNDILIGNYIIEEIETPKYYITPVQQTIRIDWGLVTECGFYNELKRGELHVIKTSEDEKVEGVKFHLLGISDSGEEVDVYAVTDEEGVAIFEVVLIGNYAIEEVETKEFYVIPESQEVTVEWGEITQCKFNNELKRGDVVVTKKSEDGNVEGVKFHLYGTAMNGQTVDLYAETDESGIATFENVLIGDYRIEEVETKEYYIIPETQEITVEWDKTSEYSFYNKLKRGQVIVTKTSEDGKVDGVKFRLYGTSMIGANVDLYAETDENGIAVFDNVLIGNYVIEEVDTKEYYIIPEDQEITVEWNGRSECSFYNELKRGQVIVTKTSEDGKVEGVKFHLFGTSMSGETVDLYAETDEAGIATFENVLIGNYIIEEVETKEYYIIPETQEIIVEWDKTSECCFYNELKRGQVVITKTSEDGNVNGIKFHLYGTAMNGQAVDLYVTTDNEGVATFENVLIGDYIIEEVETKEYYIIPESQEVTVEWSKITQCKFHNELKRGQIVVTKTSEDGVVEGIKFHLYGTAMNGQTVDLYAVTDNEGVATFENVLIGDYVIEEVETKEYYIIPETQEITVEWDKISECSFYNELKRGQVIVTKTSEDGVAEGFKFHLYGTAMNGQTVDLYAVTDNEGVATFENVLIGDYVIEEVETNEYYIIPENQEITVEWNVTFECSFYNELKRGNVTVTKTSEDRKVEEVKFHLFGVSMSGQTVDLYAITDEAGIATFDNVLIGDYLVEEVEIKEYYIIPETKKITVECDKTSECSFYNELKRGQVIVTKISEDGVIEGVKFHLFGTSMSGENVDLYVTTDENGIAVFDNILIGDYTVEEVETKEYYIIPELQEATVKWNETTEHGFYNELKRGQVLVNKTSEDDVVEGVKFHLFGTAMNGQTVDLYLVTDESGVAIFESVLIGDYVIEEVETANRYVIPEAQKISVIWDEIAELSFENKLITSEITIKKIDKDSKEPLKNAGFRIKDTDGNVAAEGNTDAEGVIKFTLPYGKYTIEETKVPVGYLKDNSIYEFNVTDNSAEIIITIENQKDPNGVPETGDESMIVMWSVLALASFTGTIVAGKKRKKKTEE